jgi:hypothetical protein
MSKASVPPRIKKRELNRLKKVWRAAIRETVKRLPLPDSLPMAPEAAPDVIALFDAILEEIGNGKKIVIALSAADLDPKAAA